MKFSIVIYIDNIGVIYLANNHTASQRTKHVHTRYHFVCEFIEDNVLKAIFVKSEDNDAVIFTKNTSSKLFLKHASKNRERVPSASN